MHRSLRLRWLAVALALAVAPAEARQERRSDEGRSHRPRQRPAATPDWREALVTADAARVGDVLARAGGRLRASWRDVHAVSPPSRRRAAEWLAELALDPDVRLVEPNVLAIHPACRQMSIDILEIVPRADLRQQDALVGLGGVDGLDAGGVIVALVDSGVDAIEELEGVLLPTIDVLAPGRDGRLRALSRGADGRAGARGAWGLHDPNGHGTALASLVHAFATGARIQPVRVVDEACEGNAFDVALGIVTAAERGAEVINVSLSTPEPTSVLAAAVAEAQALGALVVAAPGNGDAVEYPAALPGVIAVTAVDATEWPASFAPTGPRIDVAAPGVDVIGRGPDDLWLSLSGTSPSAALVSAAAAAAVRLAPELGVDERRAMVLRAVHGPPDPALADQLGAGILDLDELGR
jgi:subtilisin family serine protease